MENINKPSLLEILQTDEKLLEKFLSSILKNEIRILNMKKNGYEGTAIEEIEIGIQALKESGETGNCKLIVIRFDDNLPKRNCHYIVVKISQQSIFQDLVNRYSMREIFIVFTNNLYNSEKVRFIQMVGKNEDETDIKVNSSDNILESEFSKFIIIDLPELYDLTMENIDKSFRDQYKHLIFP